MDPANMIRLFVNGTIASLMAKTGRKENFSNMTIFEDNFAEAKIIIGLFLIFIECCLKIMHKKVQVYSTIIEGLLVIFAIFTIIKILV